MEIKRQLLILSACLATFGLTLVQSHYQTVNQATSDVDNDIEIRENFKNFVDSVARNDTERSGRYREILKEEVVKGHETFDTMKKELRLVQMTNSNRKRNFHKKISNSGVVVRKREMKPPHRTTDDEPGIYEYRFRTCSYVKEVNNVTTIPDAPVHVCRMPVEERARICKDALLEEFCTTHNIEYREDIPWGEERLYEVFLNGIYYRGRRPPFIISACKCPTAPPLYLKDATNGTDLRIYADLHAGEDEFGFTKDWRNYTDVDPEVYL